MAPGQRGASLDANLTNILSESGLLAGANTNARPAGFLGEMEGDGKKKRKRTPHDPNAPKRALTPYFLYMQSARSQISRELGDQAKPKEVADEGTRRWTAMPPADKAVSYPPVSAQDRANPRQIWDAQYQKNLAAYRVKMEAYKAGKTVPSDEEAARAVEAGKVPVDVVEEVAAETDDESSPEPPKEPSPPAKTSKRRKTQDTPAKVEVAPKSPEKEKKSSKKAKAEPEKAAPASTTKADKKKKTKKA